MVRQRPIAIALLGSFSTLVWGQCPNNNVLTGTAVTPVCSGTTTVPCVQGGQYALINVVAGNVYTFSTCGGTVVDTEITLYNNAGGTAVGYNDDAWSINAQVRFEQGRDGGYGAIYFGHFNGHPLREMTDQMGMNEAGLVFDGLSVQRGPFKQRPGVRWVSASDAVLHAMRTCATVHEVAAYARTVQVGLVGSMLFFCDRSGGYLVIEPDTMLIGHDPWYAVGNWRMSSYSDPNSIPIPRLQAGRALLAEGSDASVESATRVLESMKACRRKLGEGTLFSALFDPALGQAHLYFYHDFSERVTFDLKQELAKGDHSIDVAALFGTRPEYDALKSYITPFHQRWLFWAIACWLGIALIVGICAAIWFLRNAVRLIRGRRGSLGAPVLLGLVCAALVPLLGVLLLNEAPNYFGLGDVHPALAWLPVFILVLLAGVLFLSRKGRAPRWSVVVAIVMVVPLFVLLGYWQLLWA